MGNHSLQFEGIGTCDVHVETVELIIKPIKCCGFIGNISYFKDRFC